MRIIAIVSTSVVDQLERETIEQYAKTHPDLLNIHFNPNRPTNYYNGKSHLPAETHVMYTTAEMIPKLDHIKQTTGITSVSAIISMAIGKLFQEEINEAHDYQDTDGNAPQAEDSRRKNGQINDGRNRRAR